MDTEVIATSAVKASISVTDYLSPYINERDKEPIWDGNVYVFSNKNKSNRSCKGRVPVQVKSKENNDLTKDKITYPIRTDDLQKYLMDNGVMYFVVYIADDGNTRIYYNDLLPFKIKQLLENSEGKRTKSTELFLFPIDNSEKVDLFLNFLRDREHQKSISNIELISLEELVRMGQLKKLSFGFTSTRADMDSPYDYLFNHSVYLYATIPLGIKIPVNIMTEILCAKKTLNVPISSNGTKYYDSYGVTHKKDIDELHFGKSIVLQIMKGTTSFTMSFKYNGTLGERITDEAFLIDMIESGIISIGEIVLPVKADNPKELESFDIKRRKEHLEHLKILREALNKAGVKDDLDCNSLLHEDEVNIGILIDAFVYQKEVPLKPIDQSVGKITISNLSIMVVARKQESGMYLLSNFFNDHIGVYVTDERGKKYNISQFAIMNKDNFLNLSNIDYCSIYNDIIAIGESIPHNEHVTKLLLEMLLAYDEGKSKNIELLDAACKISEWLLNTCYDVESEYINTLNYLQAVKRKRPLNEEELNQLHLLIENSKATDAILTGAYILLDNLSGAKLHFDKLTPEEKENFIRYPIYNLWYKI